MTGAVLVFAGPLVIEPIFNRFEELPEGRTRSAVVELAQRAGIEVGDVFVIDASKRTTSANAYVTGLGSSKRVVLYDTLLRDFEPGETRLVVAHELAHVRFDDVPRGLLFLLLVAPPAMFAAARLTRAWGPDPEHPARPATVPALTASVALVALLVGIVSGQLSRRVEARADSYVARADRRGRHVHRPAEAGSRSRTSPIPTRRGCCASCSARTRRPSSGSASGAPSRPASRRLADVAAALELGQVLDVLARLPAAPVVLGGVEQLAHEARREVDA